MGQHPDKTDLRGLGFASDIEPDVLTSIRDAIAQTTGPALVGLYVYGSAVAGGFEPGVSDIDLLAVLKEDPDDELCSDLATMHEALEQVHPAWTGRIEVVYVGAARLRNPRTHIPRMAVISPGEPFHLVEAGPEWVLTWYPVREEGVQLIGPPVTEVIAELPAELFLGVVRDRLREFRVASRDDGSVGACAYAVFTVCRGLYTLEHGHRPSKLRAAEWVAQRFPEWATLIEAAKGWRQRRWKDLSLNRQASEATRDFVLAMTSGASRRVDTRPAGDGDRPGGGDGHGVAAAPNRCGRPSRPTAKPY